MQIVHSLSEIQHNPNTVITVGVFDGVHRAHKAIIQSVVEQAKKNNRRSVVVTFHPHPKEILKSETKYFYLTTLEEKIQHIEKLGVDILFVVPFTKEFSQKSFREFYGEYIVKGIGVSTVIEGENHHFGKGREGGINEIKQLGEEYNFSVSVVNSINVEGEIISSSLIKKLLNAGNMQFANRMLGYNYQFSGIVQRGDLRGRKLGYPTANVAPPENKLIPHNGIYAAKIIIDEQRYDGMMSIGVIPTFYENHQRTIEVNIFNFSEEIYDKPITLECIAWTRNEKRFDNVEQLVNEMNHDKIIIENILQNHS